MNFKKLIYSLFNKELTEIDEEQEDFTDIINLIDSYTPSIQDKFEKYIINIINHTEVKENYYPRSMNEEHPKEFKHINNINEVLKKEIDIFSDYYFLKSKKNVNTQYNSLYKIFYINEKSPLYCIKYSFTHYARCTDLKNLNKIAINDTSYMIWFFRGLLFISFDNRINTQYPQSYSQHISQLFKRNYGRSNIDIAKSFAKLPVYNEADFLVSFKNKLLDIYYPSWRLLDRVPNNEEDLNIVDMLDLQ